MAQCPPRFVRTEELIAPPDPVIDDHRPRTDVIVTVQGDERYRLPVRGSVTIGRNAKGGRVPDVRVNDDGTASKYVSRIHLEICHPTVGEVTIRDCSSTNGTFDDAGHQITDVSVSFVELPVVLHLGSVDGTTVTLHRPDPEPQPLDFDAFDVVHSGQR